MSEKTAKEFIVEFLDNNHIAKTFPDLVRVNYGTGGNFINASQLESVPGIVKYLGFTEFSGASFIIDLSKYTLGSQQKLVDLTHYGEIIEVREVPKGSPPLLYAQHAWNVAGFFGILDLTLGNQ